MRRHHFILLFLLILIFSCRKNEISQRLSQDDFFSKNFKVQLGEMTETNEQFTLVDPSDNEDEAWIDKTISELKKLNDRKNFCDRIQKNLGQPIWNQSHVIIGADSVKSVMTPIYNNNQVSGIIFSFHTSNGFKSRILPKTLLNKFRDTARSMHQVTKSTLIGLFTYFDNLQYIKKGNIAPSTEMQSNTSVNNDGYPIVYRRCWAYAVGGSGNTVIFTIQCDIQVYWGSPDDWYWYSNNDPWADGTYWESYNEDEIAKAEENNWEADHIDTLYPSNNPCLNSVIRRLLLNDTNDLGKMVNKFFSHEFGYTYYWNFDIDFEVVNNLPGDKSGKTNTISAGGNQTSHIMVNRNMFAGCTDLFAAQCIIHEFYHAFIQSMTSIMSTGTTDTAILNSFFSCFDAYNVALGGATGYYYLYGLAGDAHSYMASYLTSMTAHALAEFDNHQQDYEYYWLLSWGGLQGTTTWQYFQNHPAANDSQKGGFDFALTQDRMNAIIDALIAEKDNSSSAKGARHNFNNCY